MMPGIEKVYFIIALLLLVSRALTAQNHNPGVRFDFSVRYRFESWNGMNAKNYGDNNSSGTSSLDDNFVYQRITTCFTWNPKTNITISAHLQDSRAYGWSLRNS